MSSKRARFSAQDRRQQILKAAMELFSRKGFQGTTTRQIAERAQLNEAIIFRHFSRKEDVYWAVIEEKCADGGGRGELQDKLGANGNDRKVFAAIAEDILRRNREDSTLSRLLLFSALERHHLSRRFFRTYVARYYEALADHIRRRIREGSFRQVDPLLAARGFLGMVIYHFLIQELFGGGRYQKFEAEAVSNTLTDIWLEGMQARGSRRTRSEISSKHR